MKTTYIPMNPAACRSRDAQIKTIGNFPSPCFSRGYRFPQGMTENVQSATPEKCPLNDFASERAFSIGAGFEPARPRKVYPVISGALSATQPPVHHWRSNLFGSQTHTDQDSAVQQRVDTVEKLQHRQAPAAFKRRVIQQHR
jgi:hypothetical protein